MIQCLLFLTIRNCFFTLVNAFSSPWIWQSHDSHHMTIRGVRVNRNTRTSLFISWLAKVKKKKKKPLTTQLVTTFQLFEQLLTVFDYFFLSFSVIFFLSETQKENVNKYRCLSTFPQKKKKIEQFFSLYSNVRTCDWLSHHRPHVEKTRKRAS